MGRGQGERWGTEHGLQHLSERLKGPEPLCCGSLVLTVGAHSAQKELRHKSLTGTLTPSCLARWAGPGMHSKTLGTRGSNLLKQPQQGSPKLAPGRPTGGRRSKFHSLGHLRVSWLASLAPSGRYRLASQGQGRDQGQPPRWYALRLVWRRTGWEMRSRGWTLVSIAPCAGTLYQSAPSRARERGCARRGPITSPLQSLSPCQRLLKRATQQGATGESTVGRPSSTWN